MADSGETTRGLVAVRWTDEELWIGDAAWPVTVGQRETLAEAVRRTLTALDLTVDELAFDSAGDERRFRDAIGAASAPALSRRKR
jgi:hypothetical protein